MRTRPDAEYRQGGGARKGGTVRRFVEPDYVTPYHQGRVRRQVGDSKRDKRQE